MPRGLVLPVVASALLAASLPQECWAFDHELQIGADLFYSQQFIDEENRPRGGGIGLRARYGLTDAIALAFETAWAGHALSSADQETALRQIVTVATGVHYAIDVFHLVPYLSLLAGASVSVEAGEAKAFFLLDLGGGLDWSVTRAFSIGIAATYQLFAGAEVIPARLCVSLRFSWRHPLVRAEPGSGV